MLQQSANESLLLLRRKRLQTLLLYVALQQTQPNKFEGVSTIVEFFSSLGPFRKNAKKLVFFFAKRTVSSICRHNAHTWGTFLLGFFRNVL